MFLFVNYCSDTFRSQLFAIFKELASFSTCAGLRVRFCGRDSTYMVEIVINVIVIKINYFNLNFNFNHISRTCHIR